MSLLTNVLKLWRTGQYLLPADSGFMVKHLFANGEPGFAKLDFSGFAGMYQDRARTIPYTAVEQPLGSFTGLNGVTATAPADVNRGVVSARVNLLTKTEQFDNAAWVKAQVSVIADAVVAPNEAMTGDMLVEAAVTDQHLVSRSVATNGEVVTVSIYAKKAGRTGLHIRNGNVGVSSIFNLDSGVVTSQGSGQTATIIPMGGDWYKCSVSYTSVVGAQQVIFGLFSGGSINYPGDGTSGVYIWGASCTFATDAHLPYQRVNTDTDYDTAGFPHYLKFNGTNTAYVTPSIDFTGTDKMTLWSGVAFNNTNDGIIRMLVNHNTLGQVGFYLATPYPGNFVTVSQFGNSSESAASEPGFALGMHAAVFASQMNLGAPAITLRKNGVQTAASSSATGGGNFASSQMAIGSQLGGVQRFFNGRLYNLIVRGAQSSLSQIEATENLIRKTMRLP